MTVKIDCYTDHVTVTFPDGSWLEYENNTGDMLGYDVRKKKNFSSLLNESEGAVK